MSSINKLNRVLDEAMDKGIEKEYRQILEFLSKASNRLHSLISKSDSKQIKRLLGTAEDKTEEAVKGVETAGNVYKTINRGI